MRKTTGTIQQWVALFAGLLCVFATACNEQPSPGQSAVAAGQDTVQQAAAPLQWADSLVTGYIQRSNTFAQTFNKDSVQFHLDRRETTDSANYLVYQLGHSTESSFTTDQWLYIDSAKKTVYEYDIVDDRLVKWKY